MADTPQTMQINRLPNARNFSCNELIVEDKHKLISQVEENEITNILDMTNGTLLKSEEEVSITEELPNVNVVSPCFAGYSVQKALVAPHV